MRQLHVAAFVSLDGVMQAPGGPDEDNTGGFAHGGWVVPHWHEAVGEEVDHFFAAAGALLLGRRTHDIFAAHWPHSDEQPLADMLNAMPKYVATRSPGPLSWNNSRAIGPDAVAAVRGLKAEGEGDILTQGSADLIQSLLAADLVDRLTLMTFPLVLGPGKRLFGEGARPAGLVLTHSLTTPSGVTIGRYARSGGVEAGSFALEDPSADELRRRAEMNA